MSITEKLYERLKVVSADGFGASAATTLTSGTADFDESGRVLAIISGYGTGTVGGTIQVGSITYGTNSAGVQTSGGIPTWATLTAGSMTNGATYTATSGEVVWVEIDAASLPSGARYVRALLGNGTVNTYGSLMLIEEGKRYTPVSQSVITKESDL